MPHISIGSTKDEVLLDSCKNNDTVDNYNGVASIFINPFSPIIHHNQSLATARPTSANLTVIRWKNKEGMNKKFKLKNSIMHKWRDIGNLVVPRQQLEVWAIEKNAKECCEAMLSHWLDHPPRHYPLTWEGLYELLDDSELGQVATELKQAVDNAI